MKPFQLLAHKILESPCLKDIDRVPVKRIVYRLELDVDSLEDVNEKIKRQVEVEADMVYLLSTYYDLNEDLKAEVAEEEAVIELDLPRRNEEGLKTSVRELKANLTAHPNLAVLRRRASLATALYHTFTLLSKIVFGRNEKNKELSQNYRRELQTDS